MVPRVNRSNFSNLISKALAAALLIAIFIGLGIWQLQRAADLQELEKPVIDKPMISLLDIAKPGEALSEFAPNRIVKFSGSYAASFIAPNQKGIGNAKENWEVGIFEIPNAGAILVAREISVLSGARNSFPIEQVAIVGRLMPHQSEDRAVLTNNVSVLSRLDSALIADKTNLPIFDGFVIVQKEEISGVPSKLRLISSAPAKATVPGYYWQHISYVVIWWLMAGVVVFLPFYQKFKKNEDSENELGSRK
jgi:cytochrome oxidase assembly protein ShyY1